MVDAVEVTLSQFAFMAVSGLAGLFLGGLHTRFVHRYVEELSGLNPLRSACPACEQAILWPDNVPIISWLMLRGKCRYCEAGIPVVYPVIELISMIWCIAIALRFGPTFSWVAFMTFGALMIFGSFVDLAIFILPDRVTLGGTVLALGYNALVSMKNLELAAVGALLGVGMFWVLQQVYRIFRRDEGLGTGDVKLMGFLGALCGPWGLPTVIIGGSLTSLLASIYYMTRPDADGVQTRIPFGPFLCLGAAIHILWGDRILLFWRTVN